MQKSGNKEKSGDWTKVQSKRFPNKFYYFNKKTKESKWDKDCDGIKFDYEPQSASSTASPQCIKTKQKAGRRNGIQKRTPAQDRLVLLQKTIEKNREKGSKLDQNMRLGLDQVVAEVKTQSNVLTTNNNIKKKSFKIPKSSVQDRLKIKTVPVDDDDIKMNQPIASDLSDAAHDDEDDTEPMDWESIPEEIVLNEITTMREAKEKSPGNANELISLQTLNTNSNNFYIVLDTNIFISNLKFLENLSSYIFPQLKHSFLVVPYVVLQELDNLKHRHNDKISKIAGHAIKFLNRSFATNTSRICGQSAIKSTENLIEIQNSDDKIINCCLQIVANNNWVILLSNDINLRNKALVNDIKAYSKADLENNKISLVAELGGQLN